MCKIYLWGFCAPEMAIFFHKQMHLEEEGQIFFAKNPFNHRITNNFVWKRVPAERDQVLSRRRAEAEHGQVLPLALHRRAAALGLLTSPLIFSLNSDWSLVPLESSVPDLGHSEQVQMSNNPLV